MRLAPALDFWNADRYFQDKRARRLWHVYPMTFKAILDQNRGIGPGFDLLRIGLAFAIFYGHTLWVAGAPEQIAAVIQAAGGTPDALTIGGWDGIKRPLHVGLVPMFFALSGFLVTGSAVRLNAVSTFLANRVLRIAPALAVELSLSALILGPLLTVVPLSEYFSSGQLYRYLGNLIGAVTFSLPGVFLSNPVNGIVNVNLWTLPAEFDCYAIVAIAMLVGLLRSRAAFTAALSAYTVVAIGLNTFTQFAVMPGVFALHTITYYFFVGVALFLWRERVPYSWPLFVVSGVLSYGLLYSRHTVYLAPLFVTYCTMFIGLTKLPRINFISKGDYSYGFYLYGFPISQAVMVIAPGLHGRYWVVLLIASLLTAAFATFSWHMIEKPTLRLKRHLPEKWFPTGREFKAGVGQPTQRPGDEASITS